MLSLLAVICPPLAVYATGDRPRTVLNIGLTLCLFVPGVLHALSVVGDHRLKRRYATVMDALARTA